MPAPCSARPLKELSEQKQITFSHRQIPFPTGVREKAAGRDFRAGRHEKSADERQVKAILAGDWQTSGWKRSPAKVRQDLTSEF